jgi:hypothetical protein
MKFYNSKNYNNKKIQNFYNKNKINNKIKIIR